MCRNRNFINLLRYCRRFIGIPFLIVYLVAFNVFIDFAQAQEITPDGNTITNLKVNGNITDITTATISQNTGFNSFNKFNIDSANVVNLYLPGGTENLINTVNGGTSYLNGILNSVMDGDIGGNVYFLNPHGMMVGATGAINVGSLTAVTPTAGFMDGIYTSSGPSSLALSSILNGNIPLSRSGLISIAGNINAINDITLKANDVYITSDDNPGVITTAAVFASTPGVGNMDKVNYSDVVNINGVKAGHRFAVENGDIYIEASNDVSSSGIIAADGADGLDAGSISIYAGNDIDLNNGSLVSARGNGDSSSAGDIILIAERSHIPSSAEAVANSGIYINGATLKGKDITMLSRAGAEYSWSTDDPEPLAKGSVDFLGEEMAGVEVGTVKATANAELVIAKDSDIDADGNLFLLANSTAKASLETKEKSDIAFVYGSVNSTVNVDVQNGAEIKAKNLNLAAVNNADLDIDLKTSSSSSKIEDAIAVTKANVKSTANISSGADIEVNNLTVTAVNNSSFSTSAASKAAGEDNAGIAAAIFTAETNADASIGADLNKGNLDNVRLEAIDKITANKTIASATASSGKVKKKDSKTSNFVSGKITSSSKDKDLNSKSGATQKPKMAGAVAIADTTHNATAAIENSSGTEDYTDVNASGDVVVTAMVKDSGLQNHATSTVKNTSKKDDSNNTTVSNSLSAAISYGSYEHNADAHIGADSKITAEHLGVRSDVLIPYDTSWYKWDGLSSISNILEGGVNGFVTGYANSTGSADKGGIAGSVNYLDFNNTSEAYLGRNTQVHIIPGATDSWTSTSPSNSIFDGASLDNYLIEGASIPVETINWDAPLNIYANTEVSGVFAAGNLAKNFNGTGGKSGAASAGGSYSQVNYTNTTRAYVAEGVVLDSEDDDPDDGLTPDRVNMSIRASSSEKIINIGPSAGRGASYGSNGVFTLADIDSTTEASVDNEATINAADISVNAEDEVVSWSMAGAFNKTESVGVGLSTAMNDITTNTSAFIGDNDGNNEDGSLIDKSGKVTAENAAIQARTDGRIESISVAASMPSSSAPKESTQPDAISKADNKQKNAIDKAGNKADQEGNSSSTKPSGAKFGIGISGSASLNFTELNTEAYLDGAVLDLDEGTDNTLNIKSVNDTDITAGSGSAALIRAKNPSTKFSAGVAGSLSMNDLMNSTSAYIKDSTVSGAENLALNALSGGEQLAVAIGAAVNTSANQSKAAELAGSVSINSTANTVEAYLSGSTIKDTNNADQERQLELIAYDRTKIGTGGGSLIAGGKAGVGAAVSYSNISNNTSSYISGTTIEDGDYDDIEIKALTAVEIASGGAVAGLAKQDSTTLAGSVVISEIINNTSALIKDDSLVNADNSVKLLAEDSRDEVLDDIIDSKDEGHANSSSLDYEGSEIGTSGTEGSSILSVAGVVQAGGNNVGIAFTWNDINNTFASKIDDSTVNAGDALNQGEIDVVARSNAAITGYALGAAVSNGQFAGGGSITINEINNQTTAEISDSVEDGESGINSVTANELTVKAEDNSKIDSLAGQITVSKGSVSVGGSAAYNDISNQTSASINKMNMDISEITNITGVNESRIRTMSVSGGAAKGFAFNGSVSASEIANSTTAEIIGSKTDNIRNNLKVNAEDSSEIEALSGAAGFSTQAAVGAAVAVNRIHNTTTAHLSGSSENSLYDLENLLLNSDADSTIKSIAVGVGGGADVGVAGSTASNFINNNTSSYIDEGAKVRARNNVGVIAENDQDITNAAGSIGVGVAAAGIGASVAVNKIDGNTSAYISGSETEVTALAKDSSDKLTVNSGQLSNDLDLAGGLDISDYGRTDLSALRETESVTGIAVNSAASRSVENISTNIAGGQYVGAAGTSSVNIISGDTESYIDSFSINPGSPAVTAGIGGSGQSVSVIASDHAYSNGFVGTVAGGAVGVGLGVDTNVFSNNTRAYVRGIEGRLSEINANSMIDIDALSSQGASSLVVGGAGGGVAVVGSGTVGSFKGTTEAYLEDALITKGSLDIDSDHQSRFFVAAGGVAAGGTAAAGTFSLAEDQSTSRSYLEDSTVKEGSINIKARNETEINNWAVSGAGAGGTGIAGGVTVSLVNNTTDAYLKNFSIGTDSERAGNVIINAEDTVKVDNKTGTGGVAAGFGVGASAAVTKVDNRTQAYIENGDIYSSGDIYLNADSEHDLSTVAVSLGVGATSGIGGTAAVTLVGQDLNELNTDDNQDLDDQNIGDELDKGGDGTLSKVNDFSGDDHLNTTGTGVSEVELNEINNASKTSVDLNSGLVSGTYAQIRGDSTVKAAGKINVDAAVKDQNDINAGAGGLGLVAVGGAVGVMDVNNNVGAGVQGIGINKAELISENGSIGFGAKAVNLNNDEDAVSVNSYQGSAGLVSVGAAVAVAELTNNVNVLVDQGTSLKILNGSNESRLESKDEGSVSAEAQGYQAGLAAVGVVVADARKDGNTDLMIASDDLTDKEASLIQLASGKLVINSERTGSVNALSRAGAGGVYAGSGSSATASESGDIGAKVGNYVTITGIYSPVEITASAEPEVSARAEGYNGSLYASAGVSNARADADNNIEASVGSGSSIIVDSLTIKGENKINGTSPSVKSFAQAVSGGLLLGLNASVSNTNTAIDVTAGIGSGTDLTITGSSLQVWAENNTSQQADVSGVVAGAVAAGANFAEAKSNNTTNASVASGVKGTIDGTLAVKSSGEDKLSANSRSGSGGIAAGAAASAVTDANSITNSKIGGAVDTDGDGELDIAEIQAAKLDLIAEHSTEFNGKSSSINAAVLGASGAVVNNDLSSSVNALIRDNSSLELNELDITAHNNIKKPSLGNGFNARAGSGGLLDGAASSSDSDINKLKTDITVGDNSIINITNPLGQAADNDIEALNNIQAYDRTKLDSGGAISVALVKSKIDVKQSNTNISIGSGTSIDSTGTINMSAGTNADIQTSANAKTYGGAGAARGESESKLSTENSINIGDGVDITSHGDINLQAGPVDNDGNDINITAHTDLYNKTSLPIKTKPEADAILNQTNTIVLGTDSHSSDKASELKAVGNISLITEKGDRNVYGYGVGKDLYREVLQEIGNFFSDLVGGDDLSLEIKGGSSTDDSRTGVGVNGNLEVGIENQRYLYINEDGTLDEENSSDGIGISLGSEELANDIQERLDEINELLDAIGDADPSQYTNGKLAEEKSELESEKSNLNQQKSTLNTYKNDVDADMATVAANETAITNKQSIIDGLDSEDDKDKINDLQGEIDDLKNENNSLKSRITDCYDEYSLDDYSNACNVYKNEIQSQINAIQNRVNTINNRLDQIRNSIVSDDTSGAQDLLDQYIAEKAMLEMRLNELKDRPSVGVITIDDPITARSSNIYINADNLKGSGEIKAPGDTLIEIENKSPNFLRTNELTIPDEAGGHIYFNNVSVNSNADINERNRSETAGFTNIVTADNTTPTISILNSYIPGSDELGADIYIDNNIRNLNGEVVISSPYGSVQVKGSSETEEGADIVADTIKISAGRDITLGYINGVRNVEGDIRKNWEDIITNYEDGGEDGNSGGATPEELLGLNPDPDNPYKPSIIAGNSVYMAAKYVNVNGVIQSGLPEHEITIADTQQLRDQIADFEQRYAAGEGPIFKELYFNNIADPGSEEDLSTIPVFYNAETNTLEIQPVDTMGGHLELYGQIMNTSIGELRVMDGYGKINIDNQTDIPMKLKQINTGDNIEAEIKITDLGRRENGAEDGNPLVTIYRRLGNDIQKYEGYYSNNVDYSQVDFNNIETGRNTSYQPLENQYYSWTMADHATWTDKRDKIKKTHFFFWKSDETSTHYGNYSKEDVVEYEYSAPVVRVVDRGDNPEAYWYDRTSYIKHHDWKNDSVDESGVKHIWHKKVTHQSRKSEETITHNHNIYASNLIDINFLGYEQGEIDIDSGGDITIDGQLSNTNGTTNITTAGSIFQGDNETAVIKGNHIDLHTGNSIGESDSFLKTNLLETGYLSANATNGNIYLEETKGDLVFADITATGGDVSLTAEGNILAQDNYSLVQGNLVNLKAISGGIGTEVNKLRIDSQATTEGGLTAEAASDINIVEINDDLYLNSVDSLGGNVNIEVAAGDIVDNNTVETIDSRAEEELLSLWDEMMLMGDAAEDSAEQTVAAYERMKEREYNTYRQYRNRQIDADGNPISADSYSAEARIGLTALEKDYYINDLGWTTERLDSLEDKMTADYHQYHQAYAGIGDSDVDGWNYDVEGGWSYSVARPTDGNGNTIYDPDSYDQGQYQEWDSLVAGTSWTEGQLTNSINIGFLKETSDTEIRIEDANVSANDIRLTASSGSIGNKLTDTPATITLNGRKWSELTEQEKLMIMTAERSDIEIISDNEIKIINVEDIDIEAEGTLTATARDQIYLGSESNINVHSILAGDDVRVKTSKGIYNADNSAMVRITGQNTILEAGQNSIGTEGNPFLIDINDSILIARAGDNIFLKSSDGNDSNSLGNKLNLDTIYAVHHVNLESAGGIYNATNPNMNIRAESLHLDAKGPIGDNTATAFLKIGLDHTGVLTVSAEDEENNEDFYDIFITSPEHSLNTGRITASGDITIIGSEDINIASTTGGIETQFGNVTIDTARSINDADNDESAGITAQDINLIVDGAGLSEGSTDEQFLIGTGDNALEINTLSLGKLSAEAPDGVFITETAGDMNINTVLSTRGGVGLSSLTGDINLGTINAETGNVGLRANGSILSQAGLESVISSTGLDMLARNGQIASSDNKLRINTSIAADGLVSAEALNGIYITETRGALNSDTIFSKEGAISLETLDGDINSEFVSTQFGEIDIKAVGGIEARKVSTGAGNINMTASSGDIGLGTVSTADGEIYLLADHSIYNKQLNNDLINLQANYMSFKARNGSIGTLDRWITINAADKINATAYADIYLNQYPGDFVSDYILSETGSIGIEVPEGRIIASTLSAKEDISLETAGDILIDQLNAAELSALVHNQGAVLSVDQANILRQLTISADNIILPELNHLGSNPLYLDILGGSKEMADSVSIDIALQDYNQDEAVVFDRLYADKSYINAQSDDLIFNDQLLGSRADIYNNYYYVIVDNDNLRLFRSDMQLYPEDSHFSLIMGSDRLMLTDAYVINYNPDFIVNDFSTENNFVRETNKMPQVISIINNKFTTLFKQDSPLLADRSGMVFINRDYFDDIDKINNRDLEENEGDQDE